MEPIRDHAGLIAALGGGADLADGLKDLPDPPQAVTVRAWAARNRIPTEYWLAIIRIAAAKGIEITTHWLTETTPARKRPDPEAEDAADAEAA